MGKSVGRNKYKTIKNVLKVTSVPKAVQLTDVHQMYSFFLYT